MFEYLKFDVWCYCYYILYLILYSSLSSSYPFLFFQSSSFLTDLSPPFLLLFLILIHSLPQYSSLLIFHISFPLLFCSIFCSLSYLLLNLFFLIISFSSPPFLLPILFSSLPIYLLFLSSKSSSVLPSQIFILYVSVLP